METITMDSTTYRPGSWLGIVRSNAVVVLDGSTAPETVNALWEFLGRQEPTIEGVLNAVTGHFGTALMGMPPFAIMVQSDRLHAILRGGVTLVVRNGASETTVSGREVTTWSERSLPLPETLELFLDDGDGAGDGGGSGQDAAALPLHEGVVRLQQLARGARVSSAASSSAAPTGGAASAGDGFDAEHGDTVLSPVVSPAEAAPGWSAPALPGAVPGAVPESPVHPPAGLQPVVFEAGASEAGAVEADAAEAGALEDGEPDPDGTAGDHFPGETDADGEDVFAGFALASDAEWNAELDGPDSSELSLPPGIELPSGPDSHEPGVDEPGNGVESATPEPDAYEPGSAEAGIADSDLANTIFPSLDGDTDYAVPASGEALATGDGDIGDGTHSGLSASAPENGALENSTLDHVAPEIGSADSGTAESGAGQHYGDEADGQDDGFTTDYDHLFGETEVRSVEDAAIRLDENGQVIPKESGTAPMLPPPPAMPPAIPAHGAPGMPASGPAAAGAEASLLAGMPASSAEPNAGTPAPGPWAEPTGVLIDSVPWGPGRPAAGSHAEGEDGSQAGPAAVAGPAAGPAAGQAPGADGEDPDHDGQTIMVNRSQLPAAEELESRPPTGPMVLARLCPSGHANPPTRSLCSHCGAAINSEPREVGRPRLGRMHISTGEILDLDHSLIIGRQPSVSRVMGAGVPRLVQVQSASGDISRSHVEVRLDGWDVLLIDLKATNGTVLVREGQAPRRLGQGEQAILLDGDIAELGDGVSLLFEGLL